MTATLERLKKVPPWGWALIFSVALCLPRLGSFGFWDPWELKLAEQARQMATTNHLFDTTAGGKQTESPMLGPFLAAFGIQLVGARELGARFFLGLTAVGALMAVYWAGLGLFRRRAALLSTLALGSMSMFVLEARQLTTDVPLFAAHALAIGGLGRWAWPGNGHRRLRDLAIGGAGLAAGLLAGGGLLGFTLPVLALAGALAVGHGLSSKKGSADPIAALSDAGIGPDVGDGKPIGGTLLRPHAQTFAVLLGLLGVAVYFLVRALVSNVAGKYSFALGAIPRGGVPDKLFDTLIEELGFGLFPWSGLALFALARPLIRLDDESAQTSGRHTFGALFLLLAAGFGYALSTTQVLLSGDGRFVALVPVALAIGAFLDEALEAHRAEPVLGLCVWIGTMVVARDFFLQPEELVSVHVSSKVKWPQSVSIGYGVLAFGTLVGGALYAGLAGRRAALEPEGEPPAKPWRRTLRTALRFAGRWGHHGAVAGAVVFAFFLGHYLVPTLSNHFSFKNVLGAYEKYAKDGGELAKYRVEAKGSGFYGQKELTDLPSQDRVVEYLRKPSRVFVLVNADDLAGLDSALRSAKVAYVVVDASSSRFLLLSNQLGTGETDENPIKKHVRTDPFPEPRVKAHAVFDGKVQLLGANFPESIRRPGKIELKLYYKVLERPTGSYKIFVHFDAPGSPRFNGDHPVLGGTFPTTSWLKGDYVEDVFEIDVPLMTTPAGTYTILTGFWPGGEGRRWKITEGDNDGSDRTKVGHIDVK